MNKYVEYDYSAIVNEVFLGDLNEDKVAADPVPVSDTAFTSAAATSASVVTVTLADAGMYADNKGEWGVSVEGAYLSNDKILSVTGKGTVTVTITLTYDRIESGDVVLVSHFSNNSGVAKFIDEAVTALA